MTLLDEDAQRWYCYKDDVVFYAKGNEWVETNHPLSSPYADAHWLVRLRDYTIVVAAVLFLAEFLDFLSTVVAYVSAPSGFVELTNWAIRYFMYSLGWGSAGFFLGLSVTWLLELSAMFLAFYWTRPKAALGIALVPWLLILMAILAGVHLLAFLSNMAR